MQFSQLPNAAAPTAARGDHFPGKLNSTEQGRELEPKFARQDPSAQVAGVGSSAEEKRQAALQIVERTLTLGYQKLSASYQRASSPAAFEPLSAEQVASNILGFIEHRLRQDAAQGATQEQLQSRLEAGLSGFNKGFAEAKEKLEALSLLVPEMQRDIGQTRDLVLEGIEGLRERLLDGFVEAGPQASAIAKTKQDSWAPVSGRYEYARASEFRFNLQTAEGDRVSINARDSMALAGSFENRGSGYSLAASRSAAQQFSISVDGDLSEEEQGAIVELLAKVDKLASQFFAGDLDQAFAQAQKLGYDSQQIAAFSLNLSQVEVRRASQTYQQVANPEQSQNATKGLSRLQAELEPLTEFLQILKSALATANRVTRAPERLLADLSAEVVGSASETSREPGHRFQDFVEQLLAASR